MCKCSESLCCSAINHSASRFNGLKWWRNEMHWNEFLWSFKSGRDVCTEMEVNSREEKFSHLSKSENKREKSWTWLVKECKLDGTQRENLLVQYLCDCVGWINRRAIWQCALGNEVLVPLKKSIYLLAILWRTWHRHYEFAECRPLRWWLVLFPVKKAASCPRAPLFSSMHISTRSNSRVKGKCFSQNMTTGWSGSGNTRGQKLQAAGGESSSAENNVFSSK